MRKGRTNPLFFRQCLRLTRRADKSQLGAAVFCHSVLFSPTSAHRLGRWQLSQKALADASLVCKHSTVHRDTIKGTTSFPSISVAESPSNEYERNVEGSVCDLLTYSMVQSPSWEANWFAASQEIPRISRNPKVHYRTHKRPSVTYFNKLLEYFLRTFEGQYEIFSQNIYFPAEIRTGYLQNTKSSTSYYTASLIKKTVLGTSWLCSYIQPPNYITSFTFKQASVF